MILYMTKLLLPQVRTILQHIEIVTLPGYFCSKTPLEFQPIKRKRFFTSSTRLNMEAFTKDNVVPDVIDQVPPKLLKLHYGSIEVKPGMVLTPTQVKDRPKVEYEAEAGAYYTLIMNDPDAPSRKNPVRGEWHHWLITNIPGADVAKGEENTQYVGSGPPKGTGLHRYVFLLFKQPKGKMTFAGLSKLSNRSGDGRANHKVKDFAKKHGLDGNLVSGNFYQAEYDDYVPKLYEQLSGK
ncbi:hypothetical protein CHS0354_004483 [Potamilus streckersoni]|uniref:Phosphatidylethanolamine-binding protein n=1 Tax=Potamilus streckersoni TaxID=2493646 RepID=A0AAE0SPN3_9BIVA|nr:hypothetical protein CHS0354_004483 [Potamilus streckersoni]